MRLSMEEVQKQHENTKKLYEQGLTVAPVDVKRVLDLYNTIETLQQENERLKGAIQEWVDGVCISQKYLSQIGELQYENERLRAKLDDWKHEVQCHMDEVIARDKEIEQLRAQVTRMRELLAKAYDEIETYKCLWKDSKPGGCDCPKPTELQDEIEEILAETKTIGERKMNSMFLKCGAKRKFTVIKIDDVEKCLSPEQQSNLIDILDTIQIARGREGKNPYNEYLVINTDEPYVGEVIKILKRNGHWG